MVMPTAVTLSFLSFLSDSLDILFFQTILWRIQETSLSTKTCAGGATIVLVCHLVEDGEGDVRQHRC